MKILVINVALRPQPARIYLPLGLGYVATAMRRAGYGFDLLDLDAHPRTRQETEHFLRTNRYDVVALGTLVTGYRQVKWIARTIKEAFPETVVVAGNTVAQSIPEILLRRTGADVAVLGEGDQTIVELLERLSASRSLEGLPGLFGAPSRPVLADLDAVPFPDWDLFDAEAYIRNTSATLDDPLPPLPRDQIRVMPINTARGCPFQCTFCYHSFRGEKYRWRSAASIVAEMRARHERYGINLFLFHDELTFFSLAQAEAFADALLSSGLRVWWHADCRSGLFREEAHLGVARKLQRCGCLSLGFSLESASAEILKWMNKRATPAEFTRQVEILRRAGIVSLTSIVLGYPNETAETIHATMDCCIASGIYPSAGYLLPQPGTPMYAYARERGYITDEEEYLLRLGDRQDLRLNLTEMPDEQLRDTVEREMARCSRELGLDLVPEKLIKTGRYRSPPQPSQAA
jgi:anaerobic magnesium-protoporphyrin IX monomethyl ester cyclase